jgi:RNA polymerase sigma factor (sigma-70 family)
MPDRLLQSLVHAVRHNAASDADDAELLRRFVATRDATAFELLVWRHGAMVESVCRRALGDFADVEDAFQATFVALLKQGKSIRQQTSIAGWLHRVALRTARRARYSASRRRRREEATARPDRLANALPDADVGPVLHEEIDRLPARFRLPLVYCHLEGRSVGEAARLLGVPRGTVLSRLARGRARLRRELLRRGVVPAIAAVVLAESESTVSAALVAAAVRTIRYGPVADPVADLAQGVIRDMTMTKFKMTAGAALVVGLLGMGTMFLTQPSASASPDDKPALTDKPPSAENLSDDVNKLKAEVLRLRKELAAERDRNRKLVYDRDIAVTRAQATAASAMADRKNAEAARQSERVARETAELLCKRAEAARDRAQALLKEILKELPQPVGPDKKPEKKEDSDSDSVFLVSQHWFLYFKNDGSGFVGIGAMSGSGVNKRVNFPAGTVDAAEARRVIENSMRGSGSRSDGFEVQLRSGREKLTRGHISDPKITGRLFDAAFKKCDDQPTLKRLLAEEPLILGGN